MEMLVIFLLFSNFANILCYQIGVTAASCELSTEYDDSPLVLNSGKDKFIYPNNGEKILRFSSGDALDLICPGVNIQVDTKTYKVIAEASCVSGSTLEVEGKRVDWRDISCQSVVYKTARKTGKTCENNGTEVEIGFEVEEGRFLTVVKSCFDEETQLALYSHSKIVASVNQKIKSVPRPSWLQGSRIYDIKDVNMIYNRNNQKTVINSLLGLEANSDKYIKKTGNYFLARGHYTSRSDNFYPAQQNATFFLVNAAPQWQTNNAGNWESVEASVRDYAEENNVDLLEWTGGYGVATLPHEETGEPVELYLYNENGRKALPVPQFFWKVVYEPVSQRGLAIIVVNNPYLESYLPVCISIADNVKWINWKRLDQAKGFGYVCSMEEFRDTVDYLPDFEVKDILV